MTTIICPHCGKDVSEEAVFCASCGGALELPVAAAEETAETPAKKGTPAWWRVIRCLFSIPLTVLLIVALVAFMTLAAIRNIPQKNTMDSLFKKIAPTEMMAQVLSEGETDSFASLIYDSYERTATENDFENILSESELQEILDSSTLDEFLSEKTADYLSAFMSGETGNSITKNDLLDLVRENEALITQIAGGQKLTEEDYVMLEKAIDESDIVEEMDLSQILPRDDVTSINVVRLVYSYGVYAAIALCLVLVLLIALLNLRGHFLTSLYSGIALLVAGSIGALTLALKTLVVNILLPAELPLSSHALSAVVSMVLSGFWKVGFCMLGGAVLCIALFAIMRTIRRRRNAL